MPVPSFAQHIQVSFLDTMNRARTGGIPPKSAATPPLPDITFADVLDVVNPLQHIPVVSTLYRKYSGDQIGPLEKIAGDTLYGGPMGLASSVADLAFEKITGKDFGDTVLALLTGDGSKPSPAAMASTKLRDPNNPSVQKPQLAGNSVAATAGQPQRAETSIISARLTGQPGTPIDSTLDQAGLDALSESLNRQGMDDAVSARAVDAYRWAAGLHGSGVTWRDAE